MKTVCSSSMPFAREAFETLGDVVMREGRAIGPADVRDARLLAVRSTTPVNRALLQGSAVRFVGTATIGHDHIDRAYLEEAGIAWAYAPGCNANSVAEYFAAALLRLAVREGRALEGLTAGVIGVGNVGRRVVEVCRTLGLRVLQNDPPRARAEGPGAFVALDRVLAEADVVTLHVPLTGEGPDATRGLAGAAFFERLADGAVFVNAARGAVVDSGALCRAIDSGRVRAAVIDTWEGEPEIPRALLERAAIGTPHIAGYSFEGKVAGTRMVYEAACRFLNTGPAWDPEPLLPPPDVPELRVRATHRADEEVLDEAVAAVYDVERDDAALRAALRLPPREQAAHFDRLRKSYRVRREFRATRLALDGASPRLAARAAGLGFNVIS